MVYQPASRSYTPSGKVALLNHYPRPLCDAQDCHSLPKTIAAQPKRLVAIQPNPGIALTAATVAAVVFAFVSAAAVDP